MADTGAAGARAPDTRPVTRISTSDATSITVGGLDLVNELIGEYSYTEMLYFLTCHRRPDPAQVRVLDACLVTLMEHGLTPSAVIARLMADSVPGEAQVAIASGLLAIGSVFAGTTEQCAALLVELQTEEAAGNSDAVRLRAEAFRDSRSPIPGFGHATHKPDDPRAIRLFEVGRAAGVSGAYVDTLHRFGAAVDAASGRHLTINATGAIAALLLEIGVPIAAMRSFSVVSRAGGLAGHLLEEAERPSARAIWRASKAAVRYEPPEHD
jgi:citrate synthase